MNFTPSARPRGMGRGIKHRAIQIHIHRHRRGKTLHKFSIIMHRRTRHALHISCLLPRLEALELLHEPPELVDVESEVHDHGLDKVPEL